MTKRAGNSSIKQLQERLQSLPGVESAAVMSYIPLSLNYNSNTIFVEGKPAERGDNAPMAMTASVGPTYFKTMGTPILQGREFTEQTRRRLSKSPL